MNQGVFKVNGRTHYFGRIRSLVRTGEGKYKVEGTNGMKFQIEGGRAAGGTSRDWFLDGFGERSIVCTSIVDALNVINNS